MGADPAQGRAPAGAGEAQLTSCGWRPVGAGGALCSSIPNPSACSGLCVFTGLLSALSACLGLGMCCLPALGMLGELGAQRAWLSAGEVTDVSPCPGSA